MISKKVCMLGSFSVGKTSLVSRFVSSVFSDKYLTTVGVKVDKKVVEVNSQEVKLMLWDLAGKDDFAELSSTHLRGMSGYLLVVDTTRSQTLKIADEIRALVEREVGEVPSVVLLNKVDLVDDYDLDPEAVASFGGVQMRTSCRTGEGVEEAFLQLTRAML